MFRMLQTLIVVSFQFVEVLDKLVAGCDEAEVYKTCNDQGYSDYLVVFLRSAVAMKTCLKCFV